mmetsp:Transcript_37588/g.106167  ORF Transcript_37588/g.106167 Transcript_37588/m.106167 type:complete len:208 (-) Transcript_37588:1629-2252(-)
MASDNLLRGGHPTLGAAATVIVAVPKVPHVLRKVTHCLSLSQSALEVLYAVLQAEELLVAGVHAAKLDLLRLELEKLQLLRRETKACSSHPLPLGPEPDLMLEAAHVLLEPHVLLLQHVIHGLQLHHLPLPCQLEVLHVDGDILRQPRLALEPRVLLQHLLQGLRVAVDVIHPAPQLLLLGLEPLLQQLHVLHGIHQAVVTRHQFLR